jgi:hypothetical protein
VRIRGLLNLDQLAARFNRWIGATALADKAAPGDARMQHDPNAVVALLGEIERQRNDSGGRPERETLPPINLVALDQAERSYEPSRGQWEARLAILDAYFLAAARQQEVLAVAAESESPEEARHAVAQLLDVSESAASAVLELRLLRFTKTEQTTLRAERDSIKARLDRGPRG